MCDREQLQRAHLPKYHLWQQFLADLQKCSQIDCTSIRSHQIDLYYKWEKFLNLPSKSVHASFGPSKPALANHCGCFIHAAAAGCLDFLSSFSRLQGTVFRLEQRRQQTPVPTVCTLQDDKQPLARREIYARTSRCALQRLCATAVIAMCRRKQAQGLQGSRFARKPGVYVRH